MISRTFRPTLGRPARRGLAFPPLALSSLALTVLTLCACTSSGARLPGQAEERARLTAECEARGGVLTPASRTTGREPLDNYCRITSGPSGRLRPGS